MASSKFPVILALQGQAHKTVMVGSGATVKSALQAAKMDLASAEGNVTVNGAQAELSQRIRRDDLISVTPKNAGGR